MENLTTTTIGGRVAAGRGGGDGWCRRPGAFSHNCTSEPDRGPSPPVLGDARGSLSTPSWYNYHTMAIGKAAEKALLHPEPACLCTSETWLRAELYRVAVYLVELEIVLSTMEHRLYTVSSICTHAYTPTCTGGPDMLCIVDRPAAAGQFRLGGLH